jgi:hypothetical protein
MRSYIILYFYYVHALRDTLEALAVPVAMYLQPFVPETSSDVFPWIQSWHCGSIVPDCKGAIVKAPDVGIGVGPALVVPVVVCADGLLADKSQVCMDVSSLAFK